jgi:predicted RNA-binding Zn ribbon-like protein
MPLLLVQAFLNTEDPDTDTDLLADADSARGWLSAAGLLNADSPIRPADLVAARTLRDSIRTLLVADGETGPELAPLRELARTHQPRLTIDDRGLLAIENPKRDDLADGMFGLLLIIRAAQQDGTWERLKACGNPDCGWVFYDRSRNQHGNWCNMSACGNRLKNRRLRARRR